MAEYVKETTIQIHVAGYFADLEQKVGGFSFFAIPNGAVTGAYESNKLKKMGMRAGVHDLAFLLPGAKTLLIELKSLVGKPNDKQKEWHQIVAGLGFKSYVVTAVNGADAINQIMRILEEHGYRGVHDARN